MKSALAVMLSAAALLSAAEGQTGEHCASAQYHQFDFVLGNWLVRESSGNVVGTATFAKQYGGCVMIETWLGVGKAGASLGIIGFDRKKDRWHRDFLDPDGVVRSLEGTRNGPAMVMTGKDYPASGVRINRVIWMLTTEGTVEERWQTSSDDGRTWQVRFTGTFKRIAE